MPHHPLARHCARRSLESRSWGGGFWVRHCPCGCKPGFSRGEGGFVHEGHGQQDSFLRCEHVLCLSCGEKNVVNAGSLPAPRGLIAPALDWQDTTSLGYLLL